MTVMQLEKRRIRYQRYYKENKYIISRKVRTFFKDVIRKGIKKSKYESILGYTIAELIEHIEKQFEHWMNWDNFGIWEIDHVKQICTFNYESFECSDFKECWSLKNLRPLNATENKRRKRK